MAATSYMGKRFSNHFCPSLSLSDFDRWFLSSLQLHAQYDNIDLNHEPRHPTIILLRIVRTIHNNHAQHRSCYYFQPRAARHPTIIEGGQGRKMQE